MALKSSRDDNYLKQPFCRGSRHISLGEMRVSEVGEGKGSWQQKRRWYMGSLWRICHWRSIAVAGKLIIQSSVIRILWQGDVNYCDPSAKRSHRQWKKEIYSFRKDALLIRITAPSFKRCATMIADKQFRNQREKSNIISILFGNSFPFAIKNREKKRREEKDDKKRQRGEGCGADKYL